MIRLTIAGKAVGSWFRRAIMGLAPPPAHSDHKAWMEYYRFPMF
jgi:hypothetical protein